MNKRRILLLCIALLAVAAAVVVFLLWKPTTPKQEPFALDQCSEKDVFISYENDFRWSRQVPCESGEDSDACCARAVHILEEQVQQQKPGMDECPKQVAPHYVDRYARCAPETQKVKCSVATDKTKIVATVKDFWGLCKCMGCKKS